MSGVHHKQRVGITQFCDLFEAIDYADDKTHESACKSLAVFEDKLDATL